MTADPEQLRQLFDAKVQSFQAPEGARFHALLPFKEGVIRLRSKKASCRTIAELLKQLGVTVSHNTIARFCREQSPPSAPKEARRAAAKPAASITSKPQPGAVAELLSHRNDNGKTPDFTTSSRGRGPRIADPRNV
jgi:hypothetical protein